MYITHVSLIWMSCTSVLRRIFKIFVELFIEARFFFPIFCYTIKEYHNKIKVLPVSLVTYKFKELMEECKWNVDL